MNKDKMQEAEISLFVALHFIKNRKTEKDIYVSVDGAHVKTGDSIHFDIVKFLEEHRLIKEDDDQSRWQGIYKISNELPRIIVHSRPGSGDVNITLKDGRTVYVESKKGDLTKKEDKNIH